MDKYELASLNKALADLGILSDKRHLNHITVGPFAHKYPINNFQLTSEEVSNIINKTEALDSHQVLKMILADVIELNKTDYVALTSIYSVLAWAAFDNNNKDSFKFARKCVEANLRMQYESRRLNEYKDSIKMSVIIIPDNNYSCNKCKELTHRKYEVDDFLTNIPIPVEGCTKENGVCIALGSITSTITY